MPRLPPVILFSGCLPFIRPSATTLRILFRTFTSLLPFVLLLLTPRVLEKIRVLILNSKSSLLTPFIRVLSVPFPAGCTPPAPSSVPCPASRSFRILATTAVLRLRVLCPEALDFSKILLDSTLALLVSHSVPGLLAGSSLIVSVNILVAGVSPARKPWILKAMELSPVDF